jgi:transglutaminase-like putative cysteine protease
MNSRIARLGIWLFLAASCRAAGPDWLVSVLAANNPPWRPNAAAVQLLNLMQVRYVDTRHSVMLWRGAVRIDTEGGLANAGVQFSCNSDTDRILSAKAWVVSADGKKTQSFQLGAFIDRAAQINQYYWDAERILQFSGAGRVEVGGTFAWEIQCDQARGIEDSSTSFLPALSTVRAMFEVIPAPGTKLEWHAPSPGLAAAPGSEPGALCWEVDRERSLGTGQPTRFLPDPLRVSVRCVSASPAGSAGKATWEGLSRVIAQITDPRVDQTGAVKAEAEQLVAGKKGRWQRIRALTEFVQREIVYLEITLDKDTLAGYRPHPAAEVLRNRYGDCKDKATLLVSLLRAIGEDGRLVLLQHGDPRFVDPDWPCAEFNHAIAAIPADADCPAWWSAVDAGKLGKWVIFDPTDTATPLGVLNSGDQAGFGLIVDSSAGTLVRLPVSDPDHSLVKHAIEATLDTQGELTAKVDESLVGLAAAEVYTVRWSLPREQYQTILERRVQNGHPLAHDLTWSDDWQAADAHLGQHLAFRIPDYVHRLNNGLMLLDPNVLPDAMRLQPWTVRHRGVSWLGPTEIDEEVRFRLPPGTTIEELPDPYAEKGETVSAQLSYRAESNAVVYQRRVQRKSAFYEKPDYEALRAFYKRLSEAERQPIVLRQAPPS